MRGSREKGGGIGTRSGLGYVRAWIIGLLTVLLLIVPSGIAQPAVPLGPSDFPNHAEPSGNPNGDANIAFDPTNQRHLFACFPLTGGMNVVKSTDAGKSWGTPVGVNLNDAVLDCHVDVRPGGDKIAISYYDEGTETLEVAVSTDGGSSFSEHAVEDGAADTNHRYSSVVWAGSDRLSIVWLEDGTNRFLRAAHSNDTGATWDASSTPGDVASSVHLDHVSNVDVESGVIRFIFRDDNGVHIMTSIDGGVSWGESLISFSSDLYEASSGHSIDMVDLNTWVVVVNDGGNDTTEVWKTDDEGASWTMVHEFATSDFAHTLAQVDNQQHRQRYGLEAITDSFWTFTAQQNNSRDPDCSDRCPVQLTTTNGGSSWVIGLVDNGTDCGACTVPASVVPGENYIAVVAHGADDSNGNLWTQNPPPQVPGPTPTDFFDGLEKAIEGFGFRSAESKFFFSIALVGVAMVGAAAGTRWMRSGQMKNWIIGGAGMLVGVFTVLLGFIDLWEYVVATILGGVAISAGPESVKNTFASLRQEAEALAAIEEEQGMEEMLRGDASEAAGDGEGLPEKLAFDPEVGLEPQPGAGEAVEVQAPELVDVPEAEVEEVDAPQVNEQELQREENMEDGDDSGGDAL